MFKKTTLKQHLLLFVGTFLLICILNSCSSDDKGTGQTSFFSQPNSRQEVAIAFAENLGKGKITASKKYITETSVVLLDLSVKMGAKLEIDPDASYSVVKDSIMGKRALVQVAVGWLCAALLNRSTFGLALDNLGSGEDVFDCRV